MYCEISKVGVFLWQASFGGTPWEPVGRSLSGVSKTPVARTLRYAVVPCFAVVGTTPAPG
jgi:hypothetical protein